MRDYGGWILPRRGAELSRFGLVAGNQNQPNRLHLNGGSGSFAPGSDTTADTRQTRPVALADVDVDGLLDLVAGDVNQRNRLYRGSSTTRRAGTRVRW